MEGVTGRAVSFAVEGARLAGFDPAALAEGLDLDLERATRFDTTTPWSVFVRFSRRLGEAAGDAETLRQLGRRAAASHSFRIFALAGRVLTHPADLYFLGVRWFGPALFPMIHGEIVERADGVLEQTLALEPGYEDCPELFHVMHGAIEEMPRTWGHGRSDVDVTIAPGRVHMRIRCNSRRSGRLGRLIRRVWGARAIKPLTQEIQRQQDALQASYATVVEARDQIADQALALERVDHIGRRLSEHMEIDRLSDALVDVVIRDLGFGGVAFGYGPELRNDVVAPARVARDSGTTEGEPAFSARLQSAQGRSGSIRVWRTAAPENGKAPQERSSVLERLIPWITIALDNALSYEDLQRHANVLEDRVRERTARLASANHHLVREIEERQRATEALIESEAQLRASERLAAIGTLAAGIAHEINNPVGSILAASQFASVMLSDGASHEEIDQALDDITHEARRCGDIVRSVLQFARDEHTEKWHRRLEQILERAVRLTQTAAEDAGAELHLRLPENPVWVRANPIQIEQAVVNLIRNALEADSRTVIVHLETRETENRALIEVSDDGPGIPESERVRIFEPFYTTRRQEGGTGLGLSVVHGIALEHDGELKIDTSDEGGATALLELPLARPPAEPLEDKPEVG